MKLTEVTHRRLQKVVAWWRERQAASTTRAVADVYRQCANDLELALRDDATLHSKVKP